MRPRADSLPGVVQEEGEVKNVGIGQGLEEFSVGLQFGAVSVAEGVEFFDADQSVLIRRVTVKIFVLHEAGEGAELRQIAAKKIDLVHHAQNARDLSLRLRIRAKISRGAFA